MDLLEISQYAKCQYGNFDHFISFLLTLLNHMHFSNNQIFKRLKLYTEPPSSSQCCMNTKEEYLVRN